MNNNCYKKDKSYRVMEAPIVMMPSAYKSPINDKYLRFTVNIQPMNDSSESFKIQVKYLKSGNLERVLKFLNDLNNSTKGKNLMTRTPNFSLKEAFCKIRLYAFLACDVLNRTR